MVHSYHYFSNVFDHCGPSPRLHNLGQIVLEGRALAFAWIEQVHHGANPRRYVGRPRGECPETDETSA